MSLNDYLISLVRTGVPVAVAAALAWLASTAGIVLDERSSTSLTIGVVGLVVAVYYAVVRAAEARWPWVGLLLGARQQPTYGLPPAETQSEAEYDGAGRLRTMRSVTTWPPRPDGR